MVNRRSSGFTLIEVMVVVAIVAILAAIAIPSFSSYMRKSRRAEAVSSMQDAQLRLERWRVDNPDFTGITPTFPDSAKKWYTFTVTAVNTAPNDYTIKAEPLSDQQKDVCGTLTITNASGKITRSAAQTSGCW